MTWTMVSLNGVPPAPLLLSDAAPVVRLHHGLGGEPSSGGWWWASIVVALVIGASVLVSLLAWRGSLRGPPCERAFRSLARALRVPRGSEDMIRMLATGIGAEPVALLISESAYSRAVRTACDAGGLNDAEKAAALRVSARVFGDTAAGAGKSPGETGGGVMRGMRTG